MTNVYTCELCPVIVGSFNLHLNHLTEQSMGICDWQFETLLFGILFGQICT